MPRTALFLHSLPTMLAGFLSAAAGNSPPLLIALALFGYAFLSNVALAVVPHEPAVVWGGAKLGIWATALIFTAGTLVASWVDHRVFVPLVTRLQARRGVPPLGGWFSRAPFAVLAISGITPLPFFPFKALAFAARYPLGKYLAAIAVGRLPRYLLLAWVGYAVHIPAWLLVLVFVLLLVPLFPTVRMLLWPRHDVR